MKVYPIIDGMYFLNYVSILILEIWKCIICSAPMNWLLLLLFTCTLTTAREGRVYMHVHANAHTHTHPYY